jgi:hypothetical protein
MNSRDPIRVGQQGRLRVQFFDAAGQPIEATSVTVDLFAPGLNPDVDTPTITGLIPTYNGQGVFELLVTAIGPGGQWADRWTGSILGTPTIAVQKFSVISDGIIASYPIHGLGENTLVEILLSKDITSINGVSLDEDFGFFYTTSYNPLYSSVKKVKLDAGGMIGNLPDDTINLAILEASIEADVLHFRKAIINENVFVHARRQYVTCLAAQGLAQNILANGGVVKSKALADFKVEYDVNILGDLLRSLNDCCKKWEAQIQTGGGARTVRNPRMVVKGELDPDRPATGKLWYGLSSGEQPIGNNKYRTSGTRRWRTGWISRTPRTGNGSEW